MRRNGNTFICQLTEEEQGRIHDEYAFALSELGMNDEEIEAAWNEQTNERLWTVSHLVDIWPYLHPGISDPAPQWRFGAVTNIQVVYFDCDGDEECTEDMSGLEASRQIRASLECSYRKPIYEDGTLIGFDESDGTRIEYWDCDEETHAAMYPEDFRP